MASHTPMRIIALGLVVVAAGVGGYWLSRPEPTPPIVGVVRHQLGDNCRRSLTSSRPFDIDFRPTAVERCDEVFAVVAYRKAVQQILARIERQPRLACFLDHEHRLAGINILTNLSNDHADNSVGRRPQYGLVEPPLEHGERGRRRFHLHVHPASARCVCSTRCGHCRRPRSGSCAGFD
jgi:hypothetical protein